MVLSGRRIIELWDVIFPKGNHLAHVNPASVDLCIGTHALCEYTTSWRGQSLEECTPVHPYLMAPGELILVQTYEYLCIPNDLVMELRMKSTLAREGLNHALAFWIDPGWRGVLTMELINQARYHTIPLWPGRRVVQAIFHTLDGLATPYQGRYLDATQVEGPKQEIGEPYEPL